MVDDPKDAPPEQKTHNREPGEDGSIFDRVRPDAIKRGLESFMREGRLKNIVGELKMPKEIVSHILSQVDDTKQATIGVITREIRLFLENTNLSDELAKLLTQISFEVTTQVRFVPSDKAVKKEKAGEGIPKDTPSSIPSPDPDSESDNPKD
jgi:regulator of replication initiation timing